MIRQPHEAMKKPAEMILAQTRLGGNFFEAVLLVIMPMDKFDGPLDAAMRQRGLFNGN